MLWATQSTRSCSNDTRLVVAKARDSRMSLECWEIISRHHDRMKALLLLRYRRFIVVVGTCCWRMARNDGPSVRAVLHGEPLGMTDGVGAVSCSADLAAIIAFLLLSSSRWRHFLLVVDMLQIHWRGKRQSHPPLQNLSCSLATNIEYLNRGVSFRKPAHSTPRPSSSTWKKCFHVCGSVIVPASPFFISLVHIKQTPTNASICKKAKPYIPRQRPSKRRKATKMMLRMNLTRWVVAMGTCTKGT
jgi:hypothetical protein